MRASFDPEGLELVTKALGLSVTDGLSTILDYGRTTHTIPASLWAALGIRDEHPIPGL